MYLAVWKADSAESLRKVGKVDVVVSLESQLCDRIVKNDVVDSVESRLCGS